MFVPQRLLILAIAFITIYTIQADNQNNYKTRPGTNVNCQELKQLRDSINKMNEQLLDSFKNDFLNILQRIMENNKNEIYQTLKVEQSEILKIINDSQKTNQEKSQEAVKTFESSRGFMDNSFGLLKDVANGLVNGFANNMTINKNEIDKLLEGVKFN